MQNCPLGNHLFDVILSLREDEEDICNTPLNNLRKLSFFVQYPTKDERQRVQNRVAGQYPAKVVFGSRALMVVSSTASLHHQ